MGMTNIHRPLQLVERAKSSCAVQALIQPLGQPVMVISGPCSQNDINAHGWCLRTTNVGCWIEQDGSLDRIKMTDADAAVKVPQIRISPGLAPSDEEYPRDYVLVVQGLSGTRKAKVLVEDSLEKAATTMMHAALNVYSTVFSAAFPQRSLVAFEARSIGPGNGTFRKVDSIVQASSGTVVDLLC